MRWHSWTRSLDDGPVDLARALKAGPVLLDGGLATQLESRGHDLSGDLWSARLLAEDPAAIRAAHRDFFAAGAQVAITASYQVSFEAMVAGGIERAETTRLLALSVDLARQAADQTPEVASTQRWVAASVGPYGATLGDGMEYVGDYGLSVAELRAWHRPRLAALVEAGPDALAAETIPTLREVEALLAEVDGLALPCWISLTNDGSVTRDGDPLTEAFAMARDVAEVIAIGVNCCSVVGLEGIVRSAVATSGKPAIAYPNSGENWDAAGRQWTGEPALEPEQAASWVDAGAALVGGCCRVTPEDIAAMATHLRR
jgi:homocysteine S-methyltransferase